MKAQDRCAVVLETAWCPVEENGESKEDRHAVPFESSQHGGQSHGRQKEALEKQQGSQTVQRAILTF